MYLPQPIFQIFLPCPRKHQQTYHQNLWKLLLVKKFVRMVVMMWWSKLKLRRTRYLYKLVKDQEWEPKIAFMDPSRTFHDPKSPDEARRVQYFVKALNKASIDSIFLIPYNPGGNWIHTIIEEEKDNVYIMDPLGA